MSDAVRWLTFSALCFLVAVSVTITENLARIADHLEKVVACAGIEDGSPE